MTGGPADRPQPPYFAVIFTSVRRTGGDDEYQATARRMYDLASRQPGFLGFETARDPGGLGISVSYWDSREAIERWKADVEHREAQRRGRNDWYERYRVRVCRVEREHGGPPLSHIS